MREVPLHQDRHAFDPRKALRGGISKSILDRFVNFWQQIPTKWLQNRPQIPKPSPGIPPHRAFCGVPAVSVSRADREKERAREREGGSITGIKWLTTDWIRRLTTV